MKQTKGLLIAILVVVFVNILFQLIVLGLADSWRNNIVVLFDIHKTSIYILNIFVLLLSLASFVLGIVILGLKKPAEGRKLIIAAGVLCIIAFPLALFLIQLVEIPFFGAVFIVTLITFGQIYKSEKNGKTVVPAFAKEEHDHFELN